MLGRAMAWLVDCDVDVGYIGTQGRYRKGVRLCAMEKEVWELHQTHIISLRTGVDFCFILCQ